MKKKLRVLLVAVMMLTLLSGCAVGGNNDANVDRPANDTVTNDGQQNQPVNPESNGNSNVEEGGSSADVLPEEEESVNITDFSDFEGVYWYYTEDVDDGSGPGRSGFYLDGNGKLVYVTATTTYYEVSECRYDGLQATKTEDGVQYTFNRYFGEDLSANPCTWTVNAEGKIEYLVYSGSIYYAPVDEETFYKNIYGAEPAPIPEPTPEPSPEPEPAPGGNVSSYPFIGKYFVNEEYGYGKVYIDEESLWVNGMAVPLSNFEFKVNGDGIYYTMTDPYGSGYEYDSQYDVLSVFRGAEIVESYKAVSKEEYDAFGSN